MSDIFFALFGHKPLGIKLLLIVRNAAARIAGLEVPTVAEIMNPTFKADYRVGEKIGPWPIFFIGDERDCRRPKQQAHRFQGVGAEASRR